MFNKLLAIALLANTLAACAFTPHHDQRPYPYPATAATTKKKIQFKVLNSTAQDSLVGKIRNGWGMETADITIPESRNAVVKTAIENELLSQGYEIDPKAKHALIIRVNQLEIELAQEGMGVGYWGICDLNVFLKNKTGVYERNFVANDKVYSLMFVTAKEGVDIFYKAVQSCAKQTVAAIAEKIP